MCSRYNSLASFGGSTNCWFMAGVPCQQQALQQQPAMRDAASRVSLLRLTLQTSVALADAQSTLCELILPSG